MWTVTRWQKEMWTQRLKLVGNHCTMVCKVCCAPRKAPKNWLKSDFQHTDWYLTLWRVSLDCCSSSSVKVLLKLPHALPNLTPPWAAAAQMDTHEHTLKVTCACKRLNTSIQTHLGHTHTCTQLRVHVCVRVALGRLTEAIQLTSLLHTNQ